MTLDELRAEFINGNQFELRTGLSHVTWRNWFLKYGFIPIESQMRIQDITGGRLVARLEDVKLLKKERFKHESARD